MQRVEEPMETIHLYVVREEEKRPYSLLPLFFAFLCLVAIGALALYSGDHPYLEHETLRVPPILLPIQNFRISEPVIPTRVKTYPATSAHGTLTLTNGSIITQILPQGMIFTGNDGAEIITDAPVPVPPGNASGLGLATVLAHTVIPGSKGNISALTINQVYGTSLFIRNLYMFTGGQDTYSVTYVTHQDRLRALKQARQAMYPHTLSGLLLTPCKEIIAGNVILTWQCQFVTYHIPSFMTVTRVQIQGKQLLVDVVFVERPRRIWMK